MSVKIRFDGVELEVAADEVGEVLRQLRELGIVVPPSRPQWQASSHRLQAPAWLSSRATNTAQGELAALQLDKEMAERPEQMSSYEEQMLALRLLEMLADLNPFAGGADADKVAAALRVNHPKGIGSRAAVVNRVITNAGYAVNDAYRNPRESSGIRKWLPGPAIRDVIDSLRKGLGLPKKTIP